MLDLESARKIQMTQKITSKRRKLFELAVLHQTREQTVPNDILYLPNITVSVTVLRDLQSLSCLILTGPL